MEKHITILGVIYIALNAMFLVAACIVFAAISGGGLIGGIAESDPEVVAITGTVGTIIACFLAALSIPGIIGGIGLLQRRSWARILVLILGILNILNFPLGTIVGVYTLWVLLQDETTQLLS